MNWLWEGLYHWPYSNGWSSFIFLILLERHPLLVRQICMDLMIFYCWFCLFLRTLVLMSWVLRLNFSWHHWVHLVKSKYFNSILHNSHLSSVHSDSFAQDQFWSTLIIFQPFRDLSWILYQCNFRSSIIRDTDWLSRLFLTCAW